jgi:hypothetical protein
MNKDVPHQRSKPIPIIPKVETASDFNNSINMHKLANRSLHDLLYQKKVFENELKLDNRIKKRDSQGDLVLI